MSPSPHHSPNNQPKEPDMAEQTSTLEKPTRPTSPPPQSPHHKPEEPSPTAQVEESKNIKKSKKDPPPAHSARAPGKSAFPFLRVQKIIKADKDIPVIARDATFLISLAAEEFVKRLCDAGQKVAERDRRTIVQQRDIATVVRKADEFLFLEEIIASVTTEVSAKRQPKAAPKMTIAAAPTLLDEFVKGDKAQPDVIVNDDGTMHVAN